MYFVPSRKINRVLFTKNGPAKKERVPYRLQGRTDAQIDTRQRWRRRGLFLFIIIAGVLCYILNYKASQNILLPTPIMQTDEEDLIYVNFKDKFSVTEISRINSTEIEVRYFNKSIISDNDEYVKKDSVKNVTLDGDYPQIYYKEMKIPTKTTSKLLCTIDIKENDTEFIVNKAKSTLDFHKEYSLVRTGGYYKPDDCEPRHKVAILVPYRNRETNLAVFMFTMHPFLMKQKLEYRIFIIEQAGKEPFNRGRLFNAGFKEISKFGEWDCVVFHDVDLIPLNDKILYTCPTFPRHMSASVVEKQELTYNKYHTLFGGVASMSIVHYKKVNGYSNMYWGWGGEDNDMFWRLRASHLPVVRYNKTVARYTSLPHPKQPENPFRYRLLHDATERFKTDGLSNFVYKVLSTKLQHLYTRIIVNINPLKENITDIYNNMLKSYNIVTNLYK